MSLRKVNDMESMKEQIKTIYRTNNRIINASIFHFFCILIGAMMIYPVLWMIFASFKTQSEIFSQSLKLFPEKWLFLNYAEGWKGFGNYSFTRFFINSAIVSVISTVGTIFSAAFIGFGFARNKFKGRGFFFGTMIGTMMLPYQIIMIPQYILFHKMGWINTYLPIIVPWILGYPFFIFLLTQFMRSIPPDLDEAAKIDGCNKFSIFFRIYFPLSKPALITVAIFSFYWKWNDFIQPLIYLTKPTLYTVSVALKLFADPTSVTNWGAMLAIATLSILPIVVIFLILQSYITEGISTTGIKG